MSEVAAHTDFFFLFLSTSFPIRTFRWRIWIRSVSRPSSCAGILDTLWLLHTLWLAIFCGYAQDFIPSRLFTSRFCGYALAVSILLSFYLFMYSFPCLFVFFFLSRGKHMCHVCQEKNISEIEQGKQHENNKGDTAKECSCSDIAPV